MLSAAVSERVFSILSANESRWVEFDLLRWKLEFAAEIVKLILIWTVEMQTCVLSSISIPEILSWLQ